MFVTPYAPFTISESKIVDYADWDGQVVILLTGSADPDLLSRIKKFVIEENGKLKHIFATAPSICQRALKTSHKRADQNQPF